MRCGWLVFAVACAASSSPGSTADSTDTGSPTLRASEVAGAWAGTCSATDDWSLQLTLGELSPTTLAVAYTLDRSVDDGDPPLQGEADGAIEAGLLVVAAPVMTYTTGYVIDVNLDMALELQADGTLTGTASSVFDEASCTLSRV